MLSLFIRTMLVILTTLPLCSMVSAELVERKDPLFRIEADLLEQGQVHYSFHQIKATTIQKKLPEFVELDGAKLLEREGATIQIVKMAYVVDKAVGYFSAEHLSEPAWLKKVFNAEVTKNENEQLHVPGRGKLKIYVDSDDISSIKHSRFVHAVTQSKKLDPISLSSFSTLVRHLDHSVHIANHISLSPRKTLIVSYELSVVKKAKDTNKERLSFVKEAEAMLARTYP